VKRQFSTVNDDAMNNCYLLTEYAAQRCFLVTLFGVMGFRGKIRSCKKNIWSSKLCNTLYCQITDKNLMSEIIRRVSHLCILHIAYCILHIAYCILHIFGISDDRFIVMSINDEILNEIAYLYIF